MYSYLFWLSMAQIVLVATTHSLKKKWKIKLNQVLIYVFVS